MPVPVCCACSFHALHRCDASTDFVTLNLFSLLDVYMFCTVFLMIRTKLLIVFMPEYAAFLCRPLVGGPACILNERLCIWPPACTPWHRKKFSAIVLYRGSRAAPFVRRRCLPGLRGKSDDALLTAPKDQSWSRGSNGGPAAEGKGTSIDGSTADRGCYTGAAVQHDCIMAPAGR